MADYLLGEDEDIRRESLRLLGHMLVNPTMDLEEHLEIHLPLLMNRHYAEEQAFVNQRMAQEPDVLDMTPTFTVADRVARKISWARKLRKDAHVRRQVELHFRTDFMKRRVCSDYSFQARSHRIVQKIESRLLCTNYPKDKLKRLREQLRVPNLSGGVGSPPVKVLKMTDPAVMETAKKQAPNAPVKKSRKDVKRMIRF